MPKRTRATKETDKNKSWNRKNTVKLTEPSIIPEETILILCEGQSEELYFKGFKKTNVTIENMEGLGNSQIVDYAIELKKKEEYDNYWVVFDMDFDPGKGNSQLSSFDNTISKAKKNELQLAYSNDAFELWLYLHFHYTDQKNHRAYYYKELGKIWGINYEKEGKKYKFAKTLFNLIENDSNASRSRAKEWAKKLYEKMITLPPHQQNPVTLIFELIEDLED